MSGTVTTFLTSRTTSGTMMRKLLMESGLIMCSYCGLFPLYITCIAGRYPTCIIQETRAWSCQPHVEGYHPADETANPQRTEPIPTLDMPSRHSFHRNRNKRQPVQSPYPKASSDSQPHQIVHATLKLRTQPKNKPPGERPCELCQP